jgi:hypothetical protein
MKWPPVVFMADKKTSNTRAAYIIREKGRGKYLENVFI